MVIGRLVRLAVGLALIGMIPMRALAGPVFLDGGDRDDHGFFDGTNNVAGWKLIEQALTFLNTNATNGGSGVLVLGAHAGKALDAVTSATTAAGLSQTVVTGSAIATVSFSGFRILYVPSDENNTVGGISDAENTDLTTRKTDIQAFVNGGGGLLMLTEQGLSSPYSSLALPLPFTIDTSFSGSGGSTTLYQTPALAAAGFSITDQELSDGTPVHNSFTGPPGFNGLQVLVTNGPSGTGDIITLGGGKSTTFGVTSPVAAPAMGAWAIGFTALLLAITGHRLQRRA